MKKNIIKISTKNIINQSFKQKLETSIEQLSFEDKKQVLGMIREIFSKKSKYLLKKWKFESIERIVLNMMVWGKKEELDLSESIFLLAFDTLSLKDKMRVELLMGKFIDEDFSSRDVFNESLLGILKDEFLIDSINSVEYLNPIWKSLREKVKEEESHTDISTLEKLYEEIINSDGFETSNKHEDILS